MIAPSSFYASENAVADLVTRYLPETFGNVQMAVLLKDGRLTPYTSKRAELIELLHAFHNPVAGNAEAFAELGSFKGRRALVYFTENGYNIPAAIRRRAEQVAALTYQVGGNRDQNYVVGNEGGVTAGPPSYAMGNHFMYGPADDLHGGVGILAPPETPVFSVTKSIREVLVVKNLKDAFRSLTDDARGYYDLTVDVPKGAKTLDLRLNRKYDYQLTAQDYASGAQTPPELRLPTRQ